MTEHDIRETQDRLLVLETKFQSLLVEVNEKLTALLTGNTPKCVKMNERIDGLEKTGKERVDSLSQRFNALCGVVGVIALALVVGAIKVFLF